VYEHELLAKDVLSLPFAQHVTMFEANHGYSFLAIEGMLPFSMITDCTSVRRLNDACD